MRHRFEKFERKYNFQIPDSYRLLITELGDEYIIGNCEFYSASDFIENNLRVSGAMGVELFPFGGLDNGDCFCFLKYGENPGEYYIVLWLNETYNYVILNSTFDNFIYNCIIQEYKALLFPNEYMAEGTREEFQECIDKINNVAALFDFDLEALESSRDEKALNSLILSRDPFAVQLLCMEGKTLLEKGDKEGYRHLNRAIGFAPDYTAQYYILGKHLLPTDIKEGLEVLFRGAMTPVYASGYSYWDEDNIDVSRNVLDEIFSIIITNEDMLPNEYKDTAYMTFIRQQKPYDPNFRFVLAEKLFKDGDYIQSIKEFNNTMVLTTDYKLKIKLLETLIPIYEKVGLVWASSICKKDIKYIKGLK